MTTWKFHRARVYVALLVAAAYLPAVQSVGAVPDTAAHLHPDFKIRLNDSISQPIADSLAVRQVDSITISSADSMATLSVQSTTALTHLAEEADTVLAASSDSAVASSDSANLHLIEQSHAVAAVMDSLSLQIDSARASVRSLAEAEVTDVPLQIDSASVRRTLQKKAEVLRKDYDFSAADSLLTAAASYFPSPSDSVAFRRDSVEYASLESEMLLCENGLNMSRYVTFPEVVARKMFSIDDFFLWYPLSDRSWIHTPDSLDSGSDASFKLCYIPHDSDVMLFSSTEPSGYRSIFEMDAVHDATDSLSVTDTLTIELAGRRWGNRKSVFGKLTSSSDEIFPMLSPDGNTIWFASSGLYGVGGYDLYESSWDEDSKSWSVPVNMGFPFSSPANDYLLTVTPDEKYMIFASDRGCPKDSVSVYVIVNDPVPVKSAVDSPEELRSVAELSPNVSAVAVETVAVADEPVESEDNKEYTEKMNLVRSLRDSISNHGAELEALREEFVLSDDDDRRQELTMKILSMEKALPSLQAAYNEASVALQKIEMEFLFNGVFIDAGKAAEAADRKVVSASSSFVFTKKSMGSGGN